MSTQKIKSKSTIILLILAIFLSLSPFVFKTDKVVASDEELARDLDLYEKYQKYEKYKKYKKYKDYKEAKEKYGFENSAERLEAKKDYDLYRETKNQKYYSGYNKYKKYKNKYKPLAKYAKYGKYSKYNKSDYKNYGSSEHKEGYNRYKDFLNNIDSVTTNPGPEIRVGLWSYSNEELTESSFKISGNKIFKITNCGSSTIGNIPIGENARVTYLSGGNLEVYNSNNIIPTTNVGDKICFISADENSIDMIFDVNRPESTYDHYRGKIKIQHSYTSDNQAQEGDLRRIWVINMLPLEHYVWGFGEIGGGVEQHSKAMLVAARTYARWYIEYATKWAEEGFHLLSTSSSQIYRGYDYEKDHSSIPELARKTNGIIMKYKSNIVLAAYGSWTDGRTRKYEDGLFGSSCKEATSGDTSSVYPELSAVDDPYGKNTSLNTCALSAAGNHMVGMSANGSLVLARDHGWKWTNILTYYYSNISIIKEY